MRKTNRGGLECALGGMIRDVALCAAVFAIISCGIVDDALAVLENALAEIEVLLIKFTHFVASFCCDL